MMKNTAMLAGLRDVVAVTSPLAYTTVGFLMARQEGISLKPLTAEPGGYIWRRVFLKNRRP